MISYFKNIKTILISIAIVSILSFSFYSYKKYESLKKENLELSNNVNSYKGIISKNINDNYILELKLSDLRTSNDSLVKSIDTHLKTLNIKDKSISEASVVVQSITDTIIDTVKVKDDCSFSKVVHPNKETTISISLENDTIKTIVSATDTIWLYRYSTKEYKNYYSNFFSRLIHFDFKKLKLEKYNISHSNDMIKNDDIRVVKDIE